ALAQQHYPNRPLRMVIPWPPGQATDLAGRIVAQKLSDLLNQQVVADNRPGAGGMIGTDVVAKAAPDGYTLLAASAGPITISPLLQKAPYDYERELAPVANVGLSPYILVTNPSFPAKSALEFVAAVKAAPGRYTFSSSGAGAAAHLVAEWFNNMNGLKATHVPFKGSAPGVDRGGERTGDLLARDRCGDAAARASGAPQGLRSVARTRHCACPGHPAAREDREHARLRRRCVDRCHGSGRHVPRHREPPRNRGGSGNERSGRARADRCRRPRGRLPAHARVRSISQGAKGAFRRYHPRGQHQDRVIRQGLKTRDWCSVAVLTTSR